MFSALPVQAKMYKWVDENGQTQFGDRIPPQYLDKEHKELNERGAVIKQVDAMPTEEEKEERRKQAAIQKAEEDKIKESKKRDRVLLDTYTTERDLIAARDARLDAVLSQLQLSESIIEDAERKLVQTQNQVASIKAQGKTVPPNILEKIEKEESQLATYKEVAAGHREKQANIKEQFDEYIKRFRELKAEGEKVKADRQQNR